MSFIDRLFGSKQAAPHTQLHTQMPPQTPAEASATRRELLRAVLRDTLSRHGIPANWISAEVLTASSRGREAGIHLRLQMRHWNPRLLDCAVALERQIARRVVLYDPLAPHWLMGISWQFALADESACPEMPDPASWRDEVRAFPDVDRRAQPMMFAPTQPAGL